MKIVLIQSNEIEEAAFLNAVLEELSIARAQFGHQNPDLFRHALAGCFVRLNQASLDGLPRPVLKTCAVRVAVMALRIATENNADSVEAYLQVAFPEFEKEKK